MNRNLILGGAAVIAIVAIVFAMNQPEPTPEERLGEAVEDAADAVGESVAALTDAANEAGESIEEGLRNQAAEIEQRLTEAAADVASDVAAASEEAQQSLQAMIDEWQASGIVTEDGVDYDKAAAAVEESALSEDAKGRLTQFLTLLRDAPEVAAQKLAELEAALAQ